VHRAGSCPLSVGAVLIGPFEGSRWCGGCGASLWDLNGRSRLGQRLCLDSRSSQICDAVRRDSSKGLFGGEGGAAFELCRCEGTRRCIACESTGGGDRAERGLSHGRSGAIEAVFGQWDRHRSQQLMAGDPFDDKHGLGAERALDLCCGSRLWRWRNGLEQEAAA